jgi:XTP/dITP diphosphohydrolase
MRVVLASRNAGKLAEVSAVLAGAAEVLGLARFPEVKLPPEDGETYEENALAKARAAARATGLIALADDSGLEVAALAGGPGVRSSRYAGPPGDAAANNARLLRELSAVGGEGRRAGFVCVAALVFPGGAERVARGEVAGVIGRAARGAGGFGYDPLFVPDGFDVTFAEMPPTEKNALSHRGRAFAAVKIMLEEMRDARRR